MSKMLKDRKPPLAKSPIRLRPRRILRSNSTTSIQTPPGGLTKSKKPLNPAWEEEEEEQAGFMRPEYQSISCELRALAKMVHQELGNPSRLGGGGGGGPSITAAPSGFERGRFYEEYSARRNERLNNKRRKSSSSCDNNNNNIILSDKNGDARFKTPASKIAGLGVTVTKKKKVAAVTESLRKSVPAAYDYYYSSSGFTSLEDGLTTCNTTKNTSTKSNAAAFASAAAPRYMLRSMSKENRKPPAPNLVNSVVASGVRQTRRI